MSTRKRKLFQIDVRAILESPVGRMPGGGRSICAYEAGMRRAVEDASKGKMQAAGRFLRELEKHGLMMVTEPTDDHQYVIRIPKEWDDVAWKAMFDEFGFPPWPGEHDGLIPVERWEANYGTQPRPVTRSRRRKL